MTQLHRTPCTNRHRRYNRAVLRNSDRGTSFWQCRQHTDAKVSATLVPSSSLTPKGTLCPSLSRVTKPLPVSNAKNTGTYTYVEGNFREDGPTLIRYPLTLSSLRLIIYLNGSRDISMRDHAYLFTFPNNDRNFSGPWLLAWRVWEFQPTTGNNACLLLFRGDDVVLPCYGALFAENAWGDRSLRSFMRIG